MIGHEHWEYPEDGSQERYVEAKSSLPWLRHHLWWLFHNCVAHPLIGLLPVKPAFDLHDWTSRRMHSK